MPLYAYSAYADSGRLIKGEIDATSEIEVLDNLATRGLTAVSVRQGGTALPWWVRDFSLTGGADRLSNEDLERFFATLSAMLAARFPLTKALRFCCDQSQGRRATRVAEIVETSVANGHPLHQAMAETGGAFPDRLIAMVRLGEAANRLADLAQETATMLAAETTLRRELRGALIYPAILAIMSVLVVALIVFYLVPTLTPVFATADAPLPLPLQVMSTLRGFMLQNGTLLAAVGVIISVLLWLGRRQLRRGLTRLGARLPGIGSFLRQRETLSICQTLALMLGGGATITQALLAAREATANADYAALIAKASDSVAAGGALSEHLKASPLFDPSAASMIEAAEEADRLSEVLTTIAADLSSRTQRSMKQAVQMITPVLTLLIGLTVGALILSTISAIMDLNDIAI